MKTVHRATVPKLQRAARGASKRLEEIYIKLSAEIAAKSVPALEHKKSFWHKNPTQKPETVTYPTKTIETIIWQLTEMQLELRWWSTPVEGRGKLDKPFSLR